jgi:hypothetical protein
MEVSAIAMIPAFISADSFSRSNKAKRVLTILSPFHGNK